MRAFNDLPAVTNVCQQQLMKTDTIGKETIMGGPFFPLTINYLFKHKPSINICHTEYRAGQVVV